MVTTKLNLSMTEPSVRQIYAKQGDTGRVLDIALDQTPEDGTLRILRPDGVEVTSEAVTGGEVSESGETVTFESMTEADVTELTVGIEPVQDLSHGDPSPSNICPITGHDEVRVTRTGINVWDEEWEVGNITTIGTNGTSTDRIRSKEYIPVLPNTAYYRVSPNNIQSLYYDSNKTFLSYGIWGKGVITTPSKAHYVRFQVDPAYGTTYKNDICINYPSTDHDYHAYQGSTYTTSLGQTVYGGTLDMVTGQLVVDRAMVDLGSLTWTYYTGESIPMFYADIVGGKEFPLRGLSTYGVCSNYAVEPKSLSAADFAALGYYHAAFNGLGVATHDISRILISDSAYTDAPTFKTAMSGVQLVYELATPQTYTLTAQQIKTLVGTNNVWASSGDIVSIKFTYGGLLSELPSDATSVVGKCYCDVEQNGVSSMPFTLNVKKNERAT